MKHVKTFESFHENFDFQNLDEINEGLLTWAKNIFNKVTEKFNAWKNKLAKEAAIKLAVSIEQKNNDPKVKAKLKEITEAFKKLNADEKKQFMQIANEKNAIELATALDKETPKTWFNGNILVKENLEELNESGGKEVLGTILKGIGLGVALADIVYMCVVFCSLVGSGYVAPWALGAGMSAGLFAATGCAVLAASGLIALTGESINDKEEKM